MNPLTALLLVVKSPSPAPGTPDPDTVNAGWLGFAGLLFLCVAVFFLWKSMNKQLTKVTFDEVPVDTGHVSSEPGASGTDDSGPGAGEAGDAEPGVSELEAPQPDPTTDPA